MYNIYIKKRDGKGKSYNGVSTLSFSARRILVTFKDGSIIKFNPWDIEVFKILSNVRRWEP